MNNPQNDIHKNDKKVKINAKKEDSNRETNLLKLKNDLKNQTKSTTDLKKLEPDKKIEPPKASGFRGIKAMIESNFKLQKVKSLGPIKKNK